MKRTVLALALVFAAQAAEAASYETGNQIHEFCPPVQDPRGFGEGVGVGYIIGVFDHADSDAAKQRRFCRPAGVPVRQVRDVVCKWLTEHPERRHQTGDVLVVDALADAWPCPKQ